MCNCMTKGASNAYGEIINPEISLLTRARGTGVKRGKANV